MFFSESLDAQHVTQCTLYFKEKPLDVTVA